MSTRATTILLKAFGGRAAGCGYSALLALIFVLSIAGHPALGTESPRRVVLLTGLSLLRSEAFQIAEAFKERLRERSHDDIEVILDSLDLDVFGDESREQGLVRYLSERYRLFRPDLLVTISRGALDFVVRHRAELAGDKPIVYCCTPASFASALALPSDIPGVVIDYGWAETLAFAEGLQPNAKTLALVSGVSALDRNWLADALRDLQPFLHKYDTRYLAGLSHDSLLSELSRLPTDTIVILTRVFNDGSAQVRSWQDVAAEIARTSSAPVYSPIGSVFGQGIVGGHLVSLTEQGQAVADLALDVLDGKDPTALPHETRLPLSYYADARQLERWAFAERDLTPGAVVEFRQPTFWKQYRIPAIAALVAFIMQSGVIGQLLIQMRRRRDAERSLKESEDRMAFAAASANVGIWRIDTLTRRLWATEYCRTMLGIAGGGEITWESFRKAVHPEDHYVFDEFLRNGDCDHQPEREFRILLPGGEVRWLVFRGRCKCNEDGEPLQINGILADITAAKAAKAEAELQRMEIAHLMRAAVLGELSGAIAHELSQPLAAILANAQAAQFMLSAGAHDTQAIVQILKDIVDDDRRAGQVVHGLRRLLKKGEHQSIAISLNDLIRSTLSLLHSELVDRKINVLSELRPDLPLITGDPVQLQQVLLNLALNAIDAMASTSHNRVLCITTRASAEHIDVLISDRGRGIAAEVLPRLFQPFFTTKERGLGLGLSICSTIIGSHGGRLTLANGKGGGAVATISFPNRMQLAIAS